MILDKSWQSKCNRDHARPCHEGRNFYGGWRVACRGQGQDARLVGVERSHKLVVDARGGVAGNVFHFHNDQPSVESQGSWQFSRFLNIDCIWSGIGHIVLCYLIFGVVSQQSGKVNVHIECQFQVGIIGKSKLEGFCIFFVCKCQIVIADLACNSKRIFYSSFNFLLSSESVTVVVNVMGSDTNVSSRTCTLTFALALGKLSLAKLSACIMS